MSHIESVAQDYFYQIKKPGGMTRSEVRTEACRTHGVDADKIMARLDGMLAAGTTLRGVRHAPFVLQGFLSGDKKGGIFGFGILSGSVLQRTKTKAPPRLRVQEEYVVSFDVWDVREANSLAGQLNSIAGRKIIDYRSYSAGAPAGVLHIPGRERQKDYEGVVYGERKKEEKIPPTVLLIPEKLEKPSKPKWVITIYTKKPYPPHYSQTPDILFHLRTPEEHVKVDRFFDSVRYGQYQLVSATSHGVTITLTGRKK